MLLDGRKFAYCADIVVASHWCVRLLSDQADVGRRAAVLMGSARHSDCCIDEPVLRLVVSDVIAPLGESVQRDSTGWAFDEASVWKLAHDGTPMFRLPMSCWSQGVWAEVLPGQVANAFELLMPLASVAAGYVPGHGCSFLTAAGRGIVLSGLPHSGKTGVVLAAVSAGGRFVADDLVVLDPRQQTAMGAGLGVAVALRYLSELPQFTQRFPVGLVRRKRMTNWILRLLARALPAAAAHRFLPNRIAQRWVRTTHRTTTLKSSIATLFAPDQLAADVPLDAVVVLLRRSGANMSIEPIAAEAAASRWCLALQLEQRELLGLYQRLRFVNPQARSALLDTLTERCFEQLVVLFKACPVFLLSHDDAPNPVQLLARINELLRDD